MISQLPAYLQDIQKIVMDAAVQNTTLARRVQDRLPDLEQDVLKAGEALVPDQGQRVVYLKQYKGRFLRFCPGTKHYRCCGYRIIHIGENCPLQCSYCILKAYFQDQVLKVWANQDDLWRELDQTFQAHPNRLFRVGTGEFTDSLALEPITGYSRDLLAFLGDYSNCCLELKSKIVDLTWMEAVKRPDRVLPAWSLNSPEVVDAEEHKVASLEERLAAARECARSGFRVCLHFDPIIRYPGWETGYSRIVEMIFDYLRPADIAYLSLGSFRGMPALFDFIARQWPEAGYIHQEYVSGLDGKMRLLRPLRIEQFRFIVQRLRKHGLGRQLYFCMESDAVWRAVLGCTPKELGGLNTHLLRQAFGIEDSIL
jgi:spore photoproduct lyase